MTDHFTQIHSTKDSVHSDSAVTSEVSLSFQMCALRLDKPGYTYTVISYASRVSDAADL